jgi:hypothetical protein
LHVDGRQLAHLAGADDEDRAPFERAEDFARQLDGGVADRHRAFGKCGLGSHAFSGGERRVEQLVEQGTCASQLRRDAEGFLDLSENLRLAHDQRIEAGSHTVQMRHGFLAGLRIDVRRELFARNAVKLRQEVLNGSARGVGVVACHVQLDPIARRDDGGFVMRPCPGQRGQRAIDTTGREVEPFSKLDRGGAMADADQEQLHARSYGSS